ncbi:MAG: hypothetical protein CFE23_05105 [Flavobacterium sp. BFFFF1]|nr:response regulator transcription factor [Flavobacterium sp. BFFFF1]OYU81464.1 MAG: hypothetical protein CFE23_05105 [Flavobacterium sp. BFFFF1]
MMPIRILLVDDHPLIIEGYRTILLQTIKTDIEIFTSYSIENAYQIIFDEIAPKRFDIILLDISMPPFREKRIDNGLALGKLIRETHPAVKLVVLTMHGEPIVLFNVYETLRPESLMVKTDIDFKGFTLAFENVINGEEYFSETARNAIRTLNLQNFCKDEINRKILLMISERFTIKDIAHALKISESTVEKRKAIIRDFLNIKDGKDTEIILVAKSLGLL